MNSRKDRILNDSLCGLMIRMSLPGIAAMVLVSANAFIDAVFVGRLVDPDALAGISIIIPLFVINNAVTSLIAGGSASLLSRSIGARDEYVLNNLFRNVLFLALCGSLLLTLAGYFLRSVLFPLWVRVKKYPVTQPSITGS